MDVLQKAIKARDDFLKEHPHLRKSQKEIDSILDKCKPEDKHEVVMMMLMGALKKQQEAILLLQDHLIRQMKNE